MKREEFEAWIMALPEVRREDSFGYAFFFVGDDRRLPFVTIADSDSEYDRVSDLDREGVYRLNIGVSKATFDRLTEGMNMDSLDYTALNVFLPHPHYARQNFVCILNPEGDHAETTRQLAREAYSIARERNERKSGI